MIIRQYHSITIIPSGDLWNNNSLVIENYEMAQLAFAHSCHNVYFVKMHEMEIAQIFPSFAGDFSIYFLEYSVQCMPLPCLLVFYPGSKVHGTNMGPIWGQQDPGGPHVGLMNYAIWVCPVRLSKVTKFRASHIWCCFLYNEIIRLKFISVAYNHCGVETVIFQES